jgi:hypothetical protein
MLIEAKKQQPMLPCDFQTLGRVVDAIPNGVSFSLRGFDFAAKPAKITHPELLAACYALSPKPCDAAAR